MPPTTHHLPLRPVTIAGITIQGCPRASARHGQQDQCGKPSPQQRTTMSGISYCHATMSTGFLLPTFIKASHETFMNDTHAKPPGFFFIVLARLTAVLPSGDIFFIGFPRECSPHRSYHCSMAIISTMFNAWLVWQLFCCFKLYVLFPGSSKNSWSCHDFCIILCRGRRTLAKET